jgi:hypothetical protein
MADMRIFVCSRRLSGDNIFFAAVRLVVFTEHGVAMLSSVLNSKRAVQVNIEIMRAFVRLRQAVSTQKDLAEKLAALENNMTVDSELCLTRSVEGELKKSLNG